ncbi:MAG TPA: hypothetical protein VGB25_11710 [Candidatus Binatia bacterium]
MNRVVFRLTWPRRIYRGVIGPLIRQLLPAFVLLLLMALLLAMIGFLSFVR